MSNSTVDAELERVVEALIFAADKPITAARIVDVVASVDEQKVEEGLTEASIASVVERLNACYEETGRAFRIQRWAKGYRLATEPEVAPFLETMFSGEREQTLSRSLMETLAIVAYQQPVTKPEVDYVRGVDSGYALRKLMERSLVEVVGRSESVGRPLLYGTTKFFLEQFGLNALEDLPKPREIDELLEDPAFQNEKTKLFIAEGIEPSNGSEENASQDTKEQSLAASNGASIEDRE